MNYTALRNAKMDPVLAGPNGQAWNGGLGPQQEQQRALMVVAARSSLPTRCPSDALDATGTWLTIPRLSGETNAAYLLRQVNVGSRFAIGGTPQAVTNALQEMGLAQVQVLSDGVNGPLCGEPIGTWQSFTLVVLGPNFGSVAVTPCLLGTASCAVGTSALGMSIAQSIIPALKRAILRWKDAYGVVPRIRFDFGTPGYVEVPIMYLLGQDFVLGAPRAGVLDGVDLGDVP